jgi:ArsR family transcriptional regulator, arsenate/arsenite/antimonite-responsive transcriptional repressor
MSPENFFRALSDETRLRCVVLIQQMGELCVCELTEALGLSQPKISRHLATLKAAKILQARRDGLWVYYDLHPQLPSWIILVLQHTVTGLQNRAPFSTDKKNLLSISQHSTRCLIK